MKAKDLKNSILQMAIEGKLVPQNPNDEPASVLLERIREEKHKLIAEGKAKFPKGGESIIYIGSDGSPYEKRVDARGRVLSDKCIADELPLEELPEGWAWARLESICTLVRGSGIKRADVASEGLPCVRYGELYTTYDTSIAAVASHTSETVFSASKKLEPDEVLLTLTGENNIDIGRAVFNGTGRTLAFGGDLLALKGRSVRGDFLAMAINSSALGSQRTEASTGNIIVHLSATKVSQFLVPLPPLAEQRRIVERVNELVPLVEEYGGLEDAREALDAALPGRLRKSVLQMAVRGGLVPQDPADEPAGILLERIRGQRRKLVAEGEMKAPKGGESIIFAGSDGRRYEKRVDAKGRESEPVCIEDEIPFEIPEGWEWARLESVTTYVQRGKSPKYSTTEKYPVIAQKCNQWSGFSVEKARFIDPATVSKYADERILKDGDLLWNSTGLGTLGRMAIYDSANNKYGWAVADSHVTVIRTREDWLDYRFAFAYFAGPSVQSAIEGQASGSTKQKELAQETVKNYLIPLPPLAEQRRIVNEVNQLFKILA